jgi:ligand-binding sensor domain-containing protein
VWIGSYGRGVFRYRDGRLERLSAPAALPHDNVLALFEDREGNVWIGTQGGLLRLSPCPATTITTADGAPLSINTIYEDRDGTLFVTGLDGGLFRASNDALLPVTVLRREGSDPQRLPRKKIALWVGTDGQGAYRIEGTRSRHPQRGPGQRVHPRLLPDPDGSIDRHRRRRQSLAERPFRELHGGFGSQLLQHPHSSTTAMAGSGSRRRMV